MGFNRRKLEDRRREAAEKEAANRRATDAQVLEDAEWLIAAWNERQTRRMPMLFSPTIGAAITAGYWFVWVRCPSRRTVNAIDLRAGPSSRRSSNEPHSRPIVQVMPTECTVCRVGAALANKYRRRNAAEHRCRARANDIARAELDARVFGSVVLVKEVEMRKYVLGLTITAAILACGPIAASAQAPGAQQSPTTQPTPGGPMGQQDQTRLQRRAQKSEEEDDQDGYHGYPGGMMGGGMMGPGMMRGGMMDRGYHDWHGGRNIAGPMMMRMIFSLMDADGDGKLTLQEFQAAHERIFKAMDADHDGTVTLEEMQAFMRGH